MMLILEKGFHEDWRGSVGEGGSGQLLGCFEIDIGYVNM